MEREVDGTIVFMLLRKINVKFNETGVIGDP